MSQNFSDDVTYLATLDAQGKCPSLPELMGKLNAPVQPQDGPALPSGCVLSNIAPGLVFLTGLPANSYYLHVPMYIDEVKNAFAPGSPEYVAIQANVDNANQWTKINGFPWCPSCYHMGDGELNLKAPIIPSAANPSKDRNGNPVFATIAQATAWYANQPNPVTNTGWAHP